MRQAFRVDTITCYPTPTLLRLQHLHCKLKDSLQLPTGIPIIVEDQSNVLFLVRYIKNFGRVYQRRALQFVNVFSAYRDYAANDHLR
jgi:hypothetical protein